MFCKMGYFSQELDLMCGGINCCLSISMARRAPHRTQRDRGVFALVMACKIFLFVTYFSGYAKTPGKPGQAITLLLSHQKVNAYTAMLQPAIISASTDNQEMH